MGVALGIIFSVRYDSGVVFSIMYGPADVMDLCWRCERRLVTDSLDNRIYWGVSKGLSDLLTVFCFESMTSQLFHLVFCSTE
jgi:hypothetical protein